MQDGDTLFATLREAADPRAVEALESLVAHGADADLSHINALSLARTYGLKEDTAIAALLQASRLGAFEMSWNILCPSCGGVLDANSTLKTVRDETYRCAFCALASEPNLAIHPPLLKEGRTEDPGWGERRGRSRRIHPTPPPRTGSSTLPIEGSV